MGVRCCGYRAGPFATGVFNGGIGRGRALTSMPFRCLITWCSMSAGSGPGLRARTKRFTAAFLASSPASNIDEESSDLAGNNDWIEEEGAGWVDAAGRGIGGILGTRDVSRVYRSAMILCILDDASENMVCWSVRATSFPPAFDDPAIVPICKDVIPFICKLA